MMSLTTLIVILALALIAAACNWLLIWQHGREIANRDRQIGLQCALIAELYTKNADLRYQLDDQRLNMAVRRFGREVEYEYIYTDDQAADRGYRIYVN